LLIEHADAPIVRGMPEEVVGLYPTSQITDFVVATALAELARRQKAAIGPQMTLCRLLAARRQHPNCGADAVNHSGFEGLPGSIPTAPTINRVDSVALGLSSADSRAAKAGVLVQSWSKASNK
jgi:hypothetical protein